jgi:hypothetical protein
MPTTYRLVIKGPEHLAAAALRDQGFKSWRVVSSRIPGGWSETLFDVTEDDSSFPVVTVLAHWLAESDDRAPTNGSLLFWKVYDPAHGGAGVAPRRGPKIIDDLDGVEDNAKRAPLWATVRGRY